MSQPWHRADPALFDKEKSEVEAAYPPFPITFEGRQLDGYLIEIQLPKDYPKSIPIVRETGGEFHGRWIAT